MFLYMTGDQDQVAYHGADPAAFYLSLRLGVRGSTRDSEKMLGNGIATIPSDEVVVSPADGVICSVAESKHAVGIQLNNGIQLFIHVGLDTVSMNGTGFEVYVKEGDFVRCGQKLIGFDMDEIRKAGFKDTVMMIVVENEKELSLDFTGYGMVKAGEDVLAKIK